jgi:hypothetical protein
MGELSAGQNRQFSALLPHIRSHFSGSIAKAAPNATKTAIIAIF